MNLKERVKEFFDDSEKKIKCAKVEYDLFDRKGEHYVTIKVNLKEGYNDKELNEFLTSLDCEVDELNIDGYFWYSITKWLYFNHEVDEWAYAEISEIPKELLIS